MATTIPTYCESCGHIWSGNEVAIGAGASVSMRGNKTTCPKCGEMTPMLDGHFKVKDGLLLLEGGPQISFDKLEKIKSVLREFDSGEDVEKAENAVDQVEEEPGIMKKVKNWIESHGVSAIRTTTDLARLVDMFMRLF